MAGLVPLRISRGAHKLTWTPGCIKNASTILVKKIISRMGKRMIHHSSRTLTAKTKTKQTTTWHPKLEKLKIYSLLLGWSLGTFQDWQGTNWNGCSFTLHQEPKSKDIWSFPVVKILAFLSSHKWYITAACTQKWLLWGILDSLCQILRPLHSSPVNLAFM